MLNISQKDFCQYHQLKGKEHISLCISADEKQGCNGTALINFYINISCDRDVCSLLHSISEFINSSHLETSWKSLESTGASPGCCLAKLSLWVVARSWHMWSKQSSIQKIAWMSVSTMPPSQEIDIPRPLPAMEAWRYWTKGTPVFFLHIHTDEKASCMNNAQ